MSDELINISEEDIEINFIIDGEEYVVLKNEPGDDEIYIGKIVSIDDEYDTIISIEDEEEYERALEEYASLIELEMEEAEYED